MTQPKKRADPVTPRISLCLIAHNEERLLPGCLESVQGLVHELVVVDGGSSDATVKLAREAGARVLQRAWDDDFAAARNAALEASRGDWVLLLDADERLGPGAVEAIRRAVKRDHLDCCLLPLYQASSADASAAQVLDGSARQSDPVLLPRLFRRTADLRWEGVVHEHVRRWLGAPGRRAGALDGAPIIHYGGVRQLRDARHKQLRNIKLLRRRLQLQPDDPDARTYLAQELWNAGQHDDAVTQVEQAWEALLGQSAEQGPQSSLVDAATLLALGRIQALEFARALEVLLIARQQRREPWVHPNLSFLTGVARENQGANATDRATRLRHLQAAREAYQEALAGHQRYYPEPVLAGATTWSGSARLGAVALQLELPELALTAFEAALEGRHTDTESQLGRAEALLDLGRASEAMARLQPLLAGATTADAWLLAARTMERGGATDEARHCLDRAAQLLPAGLIAPHREHWLLAAAKK